MAAAGLEAPAACIEAASAYSRAEGGAATARLLARCPRLTALACANDLLALGAYDALRAAGRRIPDDVSVTGHNDMPLVDMIEPPLTTVRIPHAEMGRRAALLLLECLRGGEGAGRVALAPDLMVRASTGRPRPTPPEPAPP